MEYLGIGVMGTFGGKFFRSAPSGQNKRNTFQQEGLSDSGSVTQILCPSCLHSGRAVIPPFPA